MIPLYRFFFHLISSGRFISDCKEQGGYTGFAASEEDEDIISRLAALYISIEPKGDKTFFFLLQNWYLKFSIITL